MKAKNLLSSILTALFLLVSITANAQTKIYIHKSDGSSDEYNIADIDSISFNPREDITGYSKIKLNEVSGVGNDDVKFYELINTGTKDVNLEGFKIFYNANSSTGQPFPPNDDRLTWTGNATHVIKAGELFSLIGRDYPAGTRPGSFTTGLTPERILIITLKDPNGKVIDQCIRAQDTGNYAVGRDMSFSRIPDGTGPFYFTAPTPDKMNGTSAEGLLLVPKTPESIPEPEYDYTKLKLNEISGVGGDDVKFYELINTGTEDINLAGCRIYYNANSSTGGKLPTGDGSLTWTGNTNHVIKAGELFSLIGRDNPSGTKPGSFTTGLTASRILIITLKDPKGNVIDKCIRAEDTGDYAFTDKSFSRIPDGSGPFYFSWPTPDALNGASAEGLTLVPDKQE